MSLTEQEIVRYSRHIILPEVGGRGQRKLREAAVLVAGLGAVGSAAALYLAAAGVGRLTLWDPAPLQAADLEGAIAHTRDRVGQPRARSAAQALSAVNPDARVEVSADLAGLAEHAVAVVTAGDWQGLVRQAYTARRPAVVAGCSGARGAAAAFGPGQPCPECLGAERAGRLGLAPDSAAPAVAAAAGVVGTAAATEAIKLLLGIGTPLFGRVLSYDGFAARFDEAAFEPRSGCPVCGG